MTSETMTDNNMKGLDLDLDEAVTDVLHRMDFVRESDLHLRISVIGEVVTVSGVVLSRIMKRAVLQAIARVPRAKYVVDNLYTDTDIAMSVSQALSIDPTIKRVDEIQVRSYRGQVTLSGNVTNTDLILTASQLASDVPGVRTVISRLTIAEPSMLDVKVLAQLEEREQSDVQVASNPNL